MAIPAYVLQTGSRGQYVGDLQRHLGGLTADGVYGPKTATRVATYQHANGLHVDGIAGPSTLRKLGIYPIAGIDVSHYQGRIDWERVATQIGWVCAKATQGTGYVDLTAKRNVKAAREHGLNPLVYHFAEPGRGTRDAEAEAEHALAHCCGCPLVLDLEATGGLPPGPLADWAQRWREAVQRAGVATPYLYTGSDFIARKLEEERGLTDWPLWFARYRGGDHIDPGPIGAWKRWAIWQWTGSGHLNGIDGNVDMDWISTGG